MSFLQLHAIGKSYGAVKALADVNLVVGARSRTAIVGPSGSGKTTLLRLIAGFEAPDEGQVLLDGEVLADRDGSVPAYRRGIGIVSQDGALFPHLSVADNIGFGLAKSDPARGATISRLLDMVELSTAMLARKPDELSGGQQQRVALARALAVNPRLVLLDEPFSALDTGLRVSTRQAVAKLLGAAGITAILVTHDQEEALSFADQVVVMETGRLLQAGSPRELYSRPASPVVASFLGEAIFLPAEVAEGWSDCALGRVAVTDGGFCGPAQLMLRPEQISLARVEKEAGAARGEVVDIEFAGSYCAICIRLLADANDIRLRLPLADPPQIGERVRLDVAGPAHFFPS